MYTLHIMTGIGVSLKPSAVPSLSFKLATGFQEASAIACMPFAPMFDAHWQLFGLRGALIGEQPHKMQSVSLQQQLSVHYASAITGSTCSMMW